MTADREAPGWAQAPRCGARTRGGGTCRQPAVAGRRRCRMHGGAPGSGAPKGSQNALKHGIYSREVLVTRKRMMALLRASRLILGEKG